MQPRTVLLFRMIRGSFQAGPQLSAQRFNGAAKPGGGRSRPAVEQGRLHGDPIVHQNGLGFQPESARHVLAL